MTGPDQLRIEVPGDENPWPTSRLSDLPALNDQPPGEWPEQKDPSRRMRATRREFDVKPHSATQVNVSSGSLLGALPSGMVTDDDPIFTLTVANGDHVYAKVIKHLTTGAITSRTIEAAASVPVFATHTGTYYWDLAVIAIASGVVSVNQVRWGPIEVIPGYQATSDGGTGEYWLDDTDSEDPLLDFWQNGSPYDSSGVPISGYLSVRWKGPRLYLYYESTTLVDDNAVSGGDTIDDIMLVSAKLFNRRTTYDNNGNLVRLSEEYLQKEWQFYSPTTTTTTAPP